VHNAVLHLYFCASLPTLQGGLSTIADQLAFTVLLCSSELFATGSTTAMQYFCVVENSVLITMYFTDCYDDNTNVTL